MATLNSAQHTTRKPTSHHYCTYFQGNIDGTSCSYSSLNAARSAISIVAKINGTPAGQHKSVLLYEVSG
ncbi:hypothetical protein E2C01_056563 [Portunus trituberculatus]|uniref:Uncharacterized protein n=1 Tax=Portunus trituberculatus TaxID=210409 RepID=A0A5B7GZX0_PORTR|nr:hypothetical protein [Portunus trituberculatus]